MQQLQLFNKLTPINMPAKTIYDIKPSACFKASQEVFPLSRLHYNTEPALSPTYTSTSTWMLGPLRYHTPFLGKQTIFVLLFSCKVQIINRLQKLLILPNNQLDNTHTSTQGEGIHPADCPIVLHLYFFFTLEASQSLC